MSYLSIIKTAIIMFPAFAALITIPYMLYQYHKYGSIHPFKTFMIFSFALYLEIAYYLVILPLPTRKAVESLTTPRANLYLFDFIRCFIKDSGLVLTDYHTYINAFKHSSFYVPLYNLFLCMPFGIYLHYYFKCDFKKTCIYTFLLSLFFEITQLTGLYFIYPRGYRLFDVDDLLLNTSGGILGYFIAYIFMKVLPSKDKIEKEALKMGRKVSIIKRFTVFCLDIIIYSFITSLSYIIINKAYSIPIALLYYVLIPTVLKGQTLGKKFLNLRLVSIDDKKLGFFRILSREVLFLLTFIILPILFTYIAIFTTYIIPIKTNTKVVIAFIFVFIVFIYYVIIFIKLIRKKVLLYEVISRTKLVSTIN